MNRNFEKKSYFDCFKRIRESNMCYYKTVKVKANVIAEHFKIEAPSFELNIGDFNGFDFPKLGIIQNESSNQLSLAQWGLRPAWAPSDFNRANTLNARIETLSEKASYKDIVQNRCLIPISSFYEWKWLDAKGKHKQKFEISLDENPFALAGLWSLSQGALSYTVVTTVANELMAEIHNTKKRMPLILNEELRQNWLKGYPLNDFEQLNIDLKARQISGPNTLF